MLEQICDWLRNINHSLAFMAALWVIATGLHLLLLCLIFGSLYRLEKSNEKIRDSLDPAADPVRRLFERHKRGQG